MGEYTKRVRKQESENEVRLIPLEFDILDFKYKYFNKQSLLKLNITIDGKKYVADFLIDDFEHIYYPEFRSVGRYRTLSGDVIISNFINTFEKKVKHFSSKYSKKVKSDKGINSWDFEEWWQKSEIESTINEGINNWILMNKEYLNEYVSSKESSVEAFNEAAEELKEYLEKRSTFKSPTGFDLFMPQEDDISSLELSIEKAIREEDFEKASILRDKIKKLSKSS